MSPPIPTAVLEVPAVESRPLWFVAPLAAMVYPLPLKAFHAAVEAIGRGDAGPLRWVAASLSLFVVFLVPVVALVSAMRLSGLEAPTAASQRARRVALLAVAAPPLFTLVGVALYMLGNPLSDVWVLVVFWAALAIAIARSDRRAPVAPPARPESALAPASMSLRFAHGAAALGVLLAFTGVHLANHLAGLGGPDAHTAVMKSLRHFYRAPVVEPLLLVGFVFLAVSGGRLAWRLTGEATDRFRTFQIASGVYLLFFLLSHLNAVFILARTYLRIDSNWAFATGAPTGLIRDAWNVRLVPLYALAAFFALSHPFAGARAVMLAHGVRRGVADGVALWGAALSGLAAALIILGMCGLRIHLA